MHHPSLHLPRQRLWRLLCQTQQRRGYAKESDVTNARTYCLQQLQKGDRDAHLIRHVIHPRAQPAYDALRALNLELLRLPDTVSNPAIAQLRIKFWEESLEATFAGRPPREPICVALNAAAENLRRRGADEDGTSAGASRAVASLKWWTMRLLRTRAAHVDNRPFPTLASLETYAENTYAALMYATFAAMPLRSAYLDHLASHIGKAAGIVAVLRGIPVLATPSPASSQPLGGVEVSSRQQALLLPLDVMAEVGLREEDVFRMGPKAPGLQDAVFKVATRAHDHLVTARELLRDLRAGRGEAHEYEHGAEPEHMYSDDYAQNGEESDVAADLRRGFSVMLEAVPAGAFLKILEKRNFDPFVGWTLGHVLLPWGIWSAARKQEI